MCASNTVESLILFNKVTKAEQPGEVSMELTHNQQYSDQWYKTTRKWTGGVVSFRRSASRGNESSRLNLSTQSIYSVMSSLSYYTRVLYHCRVLFTHSWITVYTVILRITTEGLNMHRVRLSSPGTQTRLVNFVLSDELSR